MRQRTPLIALVKPGHFVIVERVLYNEVRVWDPSGSGEGAVREYRREAWERAWDGVALALR